MGITFEMFSRHGIIWMVWCFLLCSLLKKDSFTLLILITWLPAVFNVVDYPLQSADITLGPTAAAVPFGVIGIVVAGLVISKLG